jgi:hypothetical protein
MTLAHLQRHFNIMNQLLGPIKLPWRQIFLLDILMHGNRYNYDLLRMARLSVSKFVC